MDYNYPYNKVRTVILAGLFLLLPQFALAQSSPTCQFYPNGKPICEPPNANPLDFACPLCSEPGLPRVTFDPAKMSTMQQINALSEMLKEQYTTFEDMNELMKDRIGDEGPEPDMESDKYLPGITFSKLFPANYPDPSIRDEEVLADRQKTYDAVAQSIYLPDANPSVENQLIMQNKRQVIRQNYTVLGLAVATNRKLAMVSSADRESVNEKTAKALDKQARESTKVNLRAQHAAKGAILRAMYAQQSSLHGMYATYLGVQASQKLTSGDVSMTKPDYGNAGNGTRQGSDEDGSKSVAKASSNSLQKSSDKIIGDAKIDTPKYFDPANEIESAQSVNSALERLLNLYSKLQNARLVSNNTQFGEKAENQILNFRMTGQRQKGEMFYNSIASRADAVQRMHQQRLWVKQSVLSIENMRDTLACHDYATAQLQKFRDKIIPYLRLVNGSDPYWMQPPATKMGPYPQDGYPNNKSNLEAAFVAIAGRSPTYQLNATGDGYNRVGEFRGKLLQYDTTGFTNIRTRHSEATLASCKVADLLMLGNSVRPEYRLYPTTCVPKTVRVNTGNYTYVTDTTYCLDDNVRQILAPMTITVPPSGNIVKAVHGIVPGSPPNGLGRQCLMNVRGGQPWIVDYTRRTISNPNYNTNTRVGPPAGLLGKWLQAWKIEQYWADFRYGAPNSRDIGTEIAMRRAVDEIREINIKHADLIKAINDADSRQGGGLGDTEAVALDLSSSAGRLYSLNYQKQQVQILRRDLQIKRDELAAYEAERNRLIPPAQAPEDIKKQWDAFVDNMEKVKVKIQEDIAMTESFISIADDIVDDTVAAADQPGFDSRNNNCDIYYKPVVEKISANGVTPEQYAPVQKRCNPLIVPASRCKGQTVPDDNLVRVMPGINDD